MSHPDEDVLRRLDELTKQFSQFGVTTVTKEDLKARDDKWKAANDKLKGELEPGLF